MAGFDELAVTCKLVGAVSTSLTLNAIAPLPVSSANVTSAIGLIVGRSFTARATKLNVVLAVNPPSLTVSVILAEPLWFTAGRNATVRALAVPPRVIRLVGISVGLLEVAVTTRLAAGVSRSLTVNAIAAVCTSSSVVTSAMLVIVGASGVPLTVRRKF